MIHVIPLSHYGHNFATKFRLEKQKLSNPPPPPPPPPPPCWVPLSGLAQFSAKHFARIVEVLLASILPGVVWYGNGSGVAVFVVRWQYMLWDRVGLNVVGWGWDKRWDTSYTAQTNIHRNLIINSSDHQQFLCWGTSRSAKMDSQFLRNLIFIPFTKVASAHPSMNYFQTFWCHMIDDTFSHPYI